MLGYMSIVESSFAIVAEPNRRAILSLLLSSERSVGEIERELRLSQPSVGTAKLSTVGAPTPYVSETHVKRADAPMALEYTWGGADIRWELEPLGGGGTRLTLWHNIERGFIWVRLFCSDLYLAL